MRVCCVICGELFLQGQDVSATSCGHTFHTLCIIQWLERSKTCPTCRNKATEKTLKKLFFDAGTTEGEADPDALQQNIDNLKFQLKLKDQEAKKFTDEVELLKAQTVALREEFRSSERVIQDKDTTILALKTQMKHMGQMANDAKGAKAEAKKLKEELMLMKGVEKVLKGTTEEVTNMLNSEARSSSGLKSLATFCAALKKELTTACEARSKLRSEATAANRKHKEAVEEGRSLKQEVEALTTTICELQDDNESLEKENSSLRKKVGALEQAIASPSDDVRNSALHRLLCESPAPAILKQLHSAESCSFVTPEVVRKKPRISVESQEDEEEEEGGGLKKVETIDLTLPTPERPKKKKTSSSTVRPLVNNNSSNILKGGKGRFQGIYDKAGSSNAKNWKLVGPDVGYDGMGGHSRYDEFPKPTRLMPVTKGKKLLYRAGKKHSSQGNNQANLLSDYLKNTFDD